MDDTHLGVLVDPSVSDEQQAAIEWIEDRSDFNTDRISLESIEDESLVDFDALWWHRDRPVSTDLADRIAPPIRDYVAAGGGLFLSLHAMTIVDVLGVDDIAPDHHWTDLSDTQSGFLQKTIYDDHPIFDGVSGLDDLRLPTRPEADTDGVTYYDYIPRDGELLAASIVDATASWVDAEDAVETDGFVDRQNDFSLVTWTHGDGAVVGAGAHLVFDAEPDQSLLTTRDQLTANILSYLVDPPAEEFLASAPNDSDFDQLRSAVADAPHRPTYHFTPPANWLNDPNGVVQTSDGTYHLFYQYNPAGPVHGTIHWGHAVSRDLIHWEDRPIALAPDPDEPDSHGCYSGSAAISEDGPIAMYTGITDQRQTTCLATASSPAIEQWNKYDDNPVVAAPPDDFPARSTHRVTQEYDFRDPAVWHGDDYWYHLIGTGTEDSEGAALLYRSGDLREWEYLGALDVRGDDTPGAMWECPEWFPLDGGDLLHVSEYGHRATDRAGVPYFLGEFDVTEGRFDVETTGKLDAGRFYAPQSLEDNRGRRVLFGWLPESQTAADRWDAGWAGVMSLPRLLSLDGDELRMRPTPAIETLRGSHANYDLALSDERRNLDTRGDTVEIQATLDVDDEEAGLVLRRSTAGDERTVVRYRPSSGEVVLDRSESSARSEESEEALDTMAVETSAADTVDLRVFVDRSVIEVFVNERNAITGRVYPTRHDSDSIAAYAEGDAQLEIDIWQLASICDD